MLAENNHRKWKKAYNWNIRIKYQNNLPNNKCEIEKWCKFLKQILPIESIEIMSYNNIKIRNNVERQLNDHRRY